MVRLTAFAYLTWRFGYSYTPCQWHVRLSTPRARPRAFRAYMHIPATAPPTPIAYRRMYVSQPTSPLLPSQNLPAPTFQSAAQDRSPGHSASSHASGALHRAHPHVASQLSHHALIQSEYTLSIQGGTLVFRFYFLSWGYPLCLRP